MIAGEATGVSLAVNKIIANQVRVSPHNDKVNYRRSQASGQYFVVKTT